MVNPVRRHYETAAEHHQEFLLEQLPKPQKERPRWQEVSLMVGQLQWLCALSESIRKTAHPPVLLRADERASKDNHRDIKSDCLIAFLHTFP